MAQYFTDFSEYVVGTRPLDWTVRKEESNSTIEVKSEAGATGGVVLFVEFDYFANTFSKDGYNSQDAEVVAKFRPEGNAYYTGIGCQARERYRVAAEIADMGSPYIKEYNTRTSTESFGSGSSSVGPLGEWEYLRLRVSGTAAYAKHWAGGDPEPESWQVTTTLSTPEAGGVGIAGLDNRSAEYDFVGIGTGGDFAPTSFAFENVPNAPTGLTLTEV